MKGGPRRSSRHLLEAADTSRPLAVDIAVTAAGVAVVGAVAPAAVVDAADAVVGDAAGDGAVVDGAAADVDGDVAADDADVDDDVAGDSDDGGPRVLSRPLPPLNPFLTHLFFPFPHNGMCDGIAPVFFLSL